MSDTTSPKIPGTLSYSTLHSFAIGAHDFSVNT